MARATDYHQENLGTLSDSSSHSEFIDQLAREYKSHSQIQLFGSNKKAGILDPDSAPNISRDRILGNFSLTNTESVVSAGDRVNRPETVSSLVLNSTEFGQAAIEAMRKVIGRDSNGISRDQLRSAIQDPQLSGRDRQTLTALYNNFEPIRNLSEPRGPQAAYAITESDLREFNRIATAQTARISEAQQLESWSRNNLDRFDRGANGYVSLPEMDYAIQSPDTSATDRRMLQSIRQNYNEMHPSRQHGVTAQNVAEYARFVQADNPTNRLIAGVMQSCNEAASDITRRHLYSQPDHAQESITSNSAQQITSNDNNFRAAIMAVADSNPWTIYDSIRGNPDGTYSVTFKGAPNEPQTVNLTAEERSNLTTSNSPELWTNILSRAYDSYCRRRSHQGDDAQDSNLTRPTDVLNLLTGHATKETQIGSTPPETVTNLLERALSQKFHRPITARSTAAGTAALDSQGNRRPEDDIQAGQTYAVIGFSRDQLGAASVTIRNPRPAASDTNGGIRVIPLATFINNFDSISTGPLT